MDKKRSTGEKKTMGQEKGELTDIQDNKMRHTTTGNKAIYEAGNGRIKGCTKKRME